MIAVDERSVRVHVAAQILIDRRPEIEEGMIALMQLLVGIDRFLDGDNAVERFGRGCVDASRDARQDRVADRGRLADVRHLER